MCEHWRRADRDDPHDVPVGLILSVVFAAFVYFSERVLSTGLPYVVRDFFGNGLFIVVAWVALWYPIDLLFYYGRSYRMERNVLRTMQEMEIRVRAGD